MRFPRPRVFYGWLIIFAGGIIGALNSGFYYYGFGAFFTPMIAEFGWSRAALSGAFSVARFESGLAGPLAGMLIDRLGPRKSMAIGIVMISIGFLVISQVNGLVMFYLVFIVFLSVGNSFGTSLPAMTAVSNWFIRRRGIAVGILMGIFGIGGSVGPAVLGFLIANFGWRGAAVIAGLIFLTIGLPASQMMIRRPEDRGCLPDGDASPPAGPAGAQHANRSIYDEVMFTPRQALATGAFWYLAIAFSIRHLISSAVAVHEVPFLVDRGYALEAASALLGSTVLSSVFGRLFWGWMGDRWDRRWVLAICHTLMAVGVLIMTTINDAQSPERVVLFIAIFGIGYGGTVPVSIAMVADYFGRRNYATIQGTISTITMVGDVSSPVIAGYIFDISQSYILAFTSYALITLAAVPLFWMIRRPQQLAALASAVTVDGALPETAGGPTRGGRE